MDGTLEFMAPEVIRSTYCTTATDMWSLGCEGNIFRDSLDIVSISVSCFTCWSLGARLPSGRDQTARLKGRFSRPNTRQR